MDSSIIIPTYYRNDSLAVAIESGLQQKGVTVEIIVVDDSGEAHAKPVADEYDVCYLALSENVGPHAARERGVAEATGDVIQFLDDDDRLRREKLQKQIPLLDDETQVVYSGLEFQHWGESLLPDSEVKGDILDEALRHTTYPCCVGTMVLTREIVEEIHPFKNKHGADDIGMQIELAKRTKFDFVDEPLILINDCGRSLGKSLANVEGRKTVLESYSELYEAFPEAVRRTALVETYRREGERRLREEQWSYEAIKAFTLAAHYSPPRSIIPWIIMITSVFGRSGLNVVKRIEAFLNSR